MAFTYWLPDEQGQKQKYKTNLANVCQGLFSESCTEKGRTKRTHQIAGFETMM